MADAMTTSRRADGVLAELEGSWAGGGCALCASPDFQRDGFGPNTVLICDQCEREFHVGCLHKAGMADLQALPEGACPLCCSFLSAPTLPAAATR